MTTVAERAVISEAPAYEVWARLHGACFDRPWTGKEFADLCGLPGIVGLTCSVEERPVGFLLVRQAADEAEVLTICVLPEARRQGIARRLMESLVSCLPDAEVLFLEVDAGNEAAVELYTRLGFDKVSVRKHYYHRADGTKADALLLRLDLNGKV